jgi:hypothetical protein
MQDVGWRDGGTLAKRESLTQRATGMPRIPADLQPLPVPARWYCETSIPLPPVEIYLYCPN